MGKYCVLQWDWTTPSLQSQARVTQRTWLMGSSLQPTTWALPSCCLIRLRPRTSAWCRHRRPSAASRWKHMVHMLTLLSSVSFFKLSHTAPLWFRNSTIHTLCYGHGFISCYCLKGPPSFVSLQFWTLLFSYFFDCSLIIPVICWLSGPSHCI